MTKRKIEKLATIVYFVVSVIFALFILWANSTRTHTEMFGLASMLTLTIPACVTVDVIGRVEISHLGKLCRLLTNPQRCPSRRSSHLAAPCVEHE
jgi:hypothetical protein